ncbi:MAG: phosphoenolpyruvate carboxykinase (GTP) [Candidatus Micrarchaeaceae archaeon]
MMKFEDLKGTNPELFAKIEAYADLMQPASITLINGSKEEYDKLTEDMINGRELIRLDSRYKDCFLYRSDKKDVARSEENTYISTEEKEEAGPTNHWIAKGEMLERLKKLLQGVMKSKTMYVVPYILGPENSEFERCGVELTDSKYVVISEMIIAKTTTKALRCSKKDSFVFGIQATGNLDSKNRYIVQFPEERLIITVNSAYGGNALLSKKCHALRIESYIDKHKNRLAEHMMAIEVIDPQGKRFGITGAFPSGSGKTNLAMIKPPKAYAEKGWQVKLLSDDIIWIVLRNGELRATNPEYGFFGIAAGTNAHSNPNAMQAILTDTIFTNVALDTSTLEPWWEGLGSRPANLEDWQGNSVFEIAAHPNSRFTTPIRNYKELSPSFGSKEGLKIDAMLFGGKRKSLIPLVYEALSTEHGVLIGAMLRAETTPAVGSAVGVVRSDPMAMLPFCGYNMAEYFDHFKSVIEKAKAKPRIYGVNWFRTDSSGNFLWPGFGENMRVINWITDRLSGKAKGIETPIGIIPRIDEFNADGISEEAFNELTKIDREGWLNELEDVKPFFESFGERMPDWLWKEYYRLKDRLEI